MESLSQKIETRRLFERRPVVDPDTGARALESLPYEDFDEAEALSTLQSEHIDGLRGLYRMTVLERIN